MKRSTKYLTKAEHRTFVRAARLLDQFRDKQFERLEQGEGLARCLKTHAPRLKAWLAGTAAIPRDARVVRRMVELLVIYGRQNVSERTRARMFSAARALVGDVVFQLEYRVAEARDGRWRMRQPAVLGDGYHVAPVLSANGRPMLVAILQGRLGLIAEIPESPGRVADNGDPIADIATALTLEHYSHGLYGEGVHVAPWRPWEHPTGRYLIAVDADHRLTASIKVPDAEDGAAVVAAIKDMTVALELAKSICEESEAAAKAPTGWVDPYDDGHECDRDDGCGESWKFGTIYDKRPRND
jgi:hypothetical protein